MFFYAPATEAEMPQVARNALHQANRLISVFDRRKAEMLSDVVSDCDSCKAIVVLSIKVVLHCGEVKLQKVQKFTELSGVSVIEAHRLMKNSAPVKECLLCSAAFDKAAGDLEGQTGTPLVEQCEGIGAFDVVYYLPGRTAAPGPAEMDRWHQVRFMARMSSFLIQRKLGLKKQRFHNLVS